MRTIPALVVVALTTGALAGCFDPGTLSDPGPEPTDPGPAFEPFTVPEPDFDFSTVVQADHAAAHSAPSLHAAGYGLDLAGHTGVGSILPPGTRGSITQIDVWNEYAVVAGFEGGVGFIILDIRDPSGPEPVGFAPSVVYGWSAQFSHDGNYVFYGCQTVSSPNYPPQGAIRGDCQDTERLHGQTTSAVPGISAWDVTDKTNPRFVHWIPANGTHNLQAAFIDGDDYIFTNAVDIIRFDRTTQELEAVGEVPGRHDATVMRHPVTGDWLLYTGTDELAIYNVNDPANWGVVVHPGDWTDGVGWHDQVPFPQLVDGRALLALAGEHFQSQMGGVLDAVTIVDITDPYNPVRLGEWWPPFRDQITPWTQYTFSVHEMAATPQGQLAIAWYHGGVWVIDVSTKERQAEPVTVAAYQPHEAINVIPSFFPQTPVPMVPFVWSAGWDQRGYLVIPDMHTGVYVLEPNWGLLPLLDSGA